MKGEGGLGTEKWLIAQSVDELLVGQKPAQQRAPFVARGLERKRSEAMMKRVRRVAGVCKAACERNLGVVRERFVRDAGRASQRFLQLAIALRRGAARPSK
jgi:hypothetical protein